MTERIEVRALSSPNTTQPPRSVGIDGVSFRLHEDRSRLYSFGWTCVFCGRNARTTTGPSRMESMRRHAAKDNAYAEAGGRALPR